MESPVLRASDEAIITAFTALEIATTNYDDARSFKAPYMYGNQVAKSIERTVEAGAQARLAKARSNFTSTVLNHTLRIQGANHPGTYIEG